MLSPQARYCFALQNSDMFASGERGGKYANINPRDLAHVVRSRAEGTYRVFRFAKYHIAREQSAAYIANPVRDLYRFSLSAFADKLNFPRAS